jgi:hypothetical protein
MKTAAAQLREAAETVLRNNDSNPLRALPNFRREVIRKDVLMEAVLLNYLRQVVSDPLYSMKTVNETEKRKPTARSKQHRRTKAEREVAFAATTEIINAVYERRIGGQKLGLMVWGELQRAHEAAVDRTLSGVQVSLQEVEDAVLLEKIIHHAKVPDHALRVREVVTVKELDQLAEQARREAPARLAMVLKTAAEIVNGTASSIAAE